MSDSDKENTTVPSRPRKNRKGREDAQKDDSGAATAVADETETTTENTQTTAKKRTKSVETTLKKQKFIIEVLKEKGSMPTSTLMKLVKEKFGDGIAFKKATMAVQAFNNGTELTIQDGRRNRSKRNMERHPSQMTMVAIVDRDEDDEIVVSETYICSSDEEAIKTASRLASEGTPPDHIQVYVRYMASAEVSFG